MHSPWEMCTVPAVSSLCSFRAVGVHRRVPLVSVSSVAIIPPPPTPPSCVSLLYQHRCTHLYIVEDIVVYTRCCIVLSTSPHHCILKTPYVLSRGSHASDIYLYFELYPASCFLQLFPISRDVYPLSTPRLERFFVSLVLPPSCFDGILCFHL